MFAGIKKYPNIINEILLFDNRNIYFCNIIEFIYKNE